MSDTWLLLVVAGPLYLLTIWALIEAATRTDLPAGRRVLWIAALLLIPVVSLAVYLVVRPPRRITQLTATEPDLTAAETLVDGAERRRRGDVDDDSYRTIAADVLG